MAFILTVFSSAVYFDIYPTYTTPMDLKVALAGSLGTMPTPTEGLLLDGWPLVVGILVELCEGMFTGCRAGQANRSLTMIIYLRKVEEKPTMELDADGQNVKIETSFPMR
jgi:hypothetical protein